MPNYKAGTIVARNYLAQARVLARSFVVFHGDIPFYTLVIDGDESDRAQPGVGIVLLPEDLGIAPAELESMMLIYDVMELATALKPSMLAELGRRSSHAVAYFDPDIRIYAPLHDIFGIARESGVLLTPHTLFPVPRDGRHLDERAIMHAGIYNLGFIAVGARAYPFLTWWHERLVVDAVVDFANALFTDQRWIDWVPALFDHRISRDQGLNAAYWNLHERQITRVGEVYRAGNDPLRFMHFSGYDPAIPWLLSKHMSDRPRVLLSASPELRELTEAYKAELEEFGHPTLRRSPYALDTLPNGLKLSRSVRRAARQLLLEPRIDVGIPPGAFSDPDGFLAWLTAPVMGQGEARISVAEWAIWLERGDVQAAYPDVFGIHGKGFQEWCAADPYAQEALSALGLGRSDSLVNRLPGTRPIASWSRPPSQRQAYGWSVIAYANSELGVGEAGRRTAEAVAASGVPMELVGTQYGTFSRQQHSGRIEVAQSVGFENSITCVNADQLPHISTLLGLDLLAGRRVGLWFWELSEFPERNFGAFDYVDEVWVASEFTREAVQAATDKKVKLITLPIQIPVRPTGYSRRSLKLPEDRFIFLSNFDYLSVYERKNPIGVIKAYLAAFSPDDGAVLVVKSINGSRKPLDMEHVRSFANHRPDVIFMDDYVSTNEMKAMIELADCYVSLHRAEGYGLNLADAIARRTPTIATGYSGNMDFMNSTTSMLVSFSIAEVGPLARPYDPRSVWAEPDIADASVKMRQLFDDPALGMTIADRAQQFVAQNHSLSSAVTSMSSELTMLSTGVRS